MAILYRPLKSKLPFVVEPFNPDTFEARAELFAEKMPVKVALNTAVFFLNILGNLKEVTKDFLAKPKAEKKKKILSVLTSVALEVGMRLFTSLLKTTSSKSKKSQK
jgi:predicted small integral membrane protein